ncbi:Carbohydrate deacetylase [Schistosoma japonicum]|nr:Carbohydrate deacetylase [Schistosoma japonicum]
MLFFTGLHFNLTEGKPLSNVKCIQSLLDDHGCFLGKHGFRSRLTSSLVHMDEVEIELESQVNAFRDIFGTIPSHFDGHQHVHILPAEINFYKEVSDQAVKAKEIFASYNLKYTQKFIGMTLMGKNQTLASLDQLLSSVDNCDVVEFMVHPGHKIVKHDNEINNIAGCGVGPDLFSQSSDREYEMAFLTSDEFRHYLTERNYELLSFSDLS